MVRSRFPNSRLESETGNVCQILGVASSPSETTIRISVEQRFVRCGRPRDSLWWNSREELSLAITCYANSLRRGNYLSMTVAISCCQPDTDSHGHIESLVCKGEKSTKGRESDHTSTCHKFCLRSERVRTSIHCRA